MAKTILGTIGVIKQSSGSYLHHTYSVVCILLLFHCHLVGRVQFGGRVASESQGAVLVAAQSLCSTLIGRRILEYGNRFYFNL